MKILSLFVLLLASICFLSGADSMAVEKSQVPMGSHLPGKNMGTPPLGAGRCKPITCEEAKATCGNISDGCGKVLNCGIVKQATVTVDPPQYTGICPKTFKFTATITADRKGTTSYQWSHPHFNQGGTVEFNAPGTKQITFEWSVPHSLAFNYQWLYFSACGIDPVKASFKANCTNLKPIGGNAPPAGVGPNLAK